MVAACDSKAAIFSESGIDVAEALKHKAETGSLAGLAGTKETECDDVLTMECDILLPSALENAITLKNVDECRAFFRDLCTPAELQALADRWAVVEWLQKGLPYREIHRLTGVSVTTIGRAARTSKVFRSQTIRSGGFSSASR